MWRIGTRLNSRAPAVVVVTFLAITVPGTATAQQWVAAWGSSMQSASPDRWTVTNASVRLLVRSTIDGDRVRVRLENTIGDEPLTIGAASVAVQRTGAAVVGGSSRPLRFDGSDSVTIPAWASVMNDAVSLAV